MDRSYQERTPSGGETTYSMNPLAAPTIAPGTILLGKFRVVGLLGVGGMGSVYRVDHLLMESQFALKCLNKFQEANASWRRFQNEAKAAHMLDHPNHLKVFEFGLLESGQPFFLMDLVEGVTLADEIKRLGHLPIDRAVSIFIQVAFAMGYAHERRIIHRDLKPSNIMISPAKTQLEVEHVKVVDFGIAKLTGIDEFNQQTLTKTGEVFGSPFYMSPEQCTGAPVDHRSDLYSLGCVFYETLTSAPPFMGENALATMMKHQNEIQLPLKEASLGMSYPAALEAIISKLLEKEPDNRYQTAGQLANDLIALERAINEKKQLASGQGPTTAAALTDGYRRPAFDSFLKSLTLPKFIAYGMCMFLLGAVCLYASMYVMSRQGIKTVVIEQSEEPQTNLEGQQFWSQIEGDKKTFYFPDNRVLGMLLAENGSKGLARGRVNSPTKMKTGLIASNFLTPEYIERFRTEEISVFDFDANPVVAEHFNALKKFTDLRCLNVSGTAFGDKDLAILPSFKKLQYLNLSHTDVNCENLLKMPCFYNLNSLDVSHVIGSDLVLKSADKFPRLYALSASVCGLGSGDITWLAKSKTLRVLSLAQNPISDVAVSKLTPIKTLEWLDISKTLVTPKVAETLKKFPNLKSVELGERPEWTSSSKEKFIAELKKANPMLQVRFESHSVFPAIMPGFNWQSIGLTAHANTTRLFAPPPTGSITERRFAPVTSDP